MGIRTLSRAYDTERVILENIAAAWADNTQVTGSIDLYIGNNHVCDSCKSVIEQFTAMFPNIVINDHILGR